MTEFFFLSGCAISSYLLGSVPFGLIISKCRGIDIRKVGSGNIGATNVFRSVGKTWGTLTFAADFLKGLAASALVPRLAAAAGCPQRMESVVAVICTLAVVAGHNWPVYLRFHGGKGIATSAGALTGLAWQALLAGLAAWIVVFLAARYVSLASIIAAIITAAAAWIFYAREGMLLPVAMTILAGWALWRHRSNVERLIEGREHRFEFGRRRGRRDSCTH